MKKIYLLLIFATNATLKLAAADLEANLNMLKNSLLQLQRQLIPTTGKPVKKRDLGPEIKATKEVTEKLLNFLSLKFIANKEFSETELHPYKELVNKIMQNLTDEQQKEVQQHLMSERLRLEGMMKLLTSQNLLIPEKKEKTSESSSESSETESESES